MKKIIIGTVLVVALLVIGKFTIYDDDQIEERSEHYLEVRTLYYDSREMWLDDGSGENEREYPLMWRLKELFYQSLKIYRNYMTECGISNGDINYCTTDEYSGSYNLITTDDGFITELYIKYDDFVQYLKVEVKENEYMYLVENYLTVDGTITYGTVFEYNYDEDIKYYRIMNEKLSEYTIFDVDGFYKFSYAERISHTAESNVFGYTDEDKKLTYMFKDDADNEIQVHSITFFDEDYDLLFYVYFKEDQIQIMRWNSDYVSNWDEHSDIVCSSEEMECNSFKEHELYTYYYKYNEEYSIQEMLSLDMFDVTFSEITVLDLEREEMFILDNYETLRSYNNFDYEELEIENYDFSHIYEIDMDIVEELLN